MTLEVPMNGLSLDEIITGILLLNMAVGEMFDYFNNDCECSLDWNEFNELYTLVKGVKL